MLQSVHNDPVLIINISFLVNLFRFAKLKLRKNLARLPSIASSFVVQIGLSSLGRSRRNEKLLCMLPPSLVTITFTSVVEL